MRLIVSREQAALFLMYTLHLTKDQAIQRVNHASEYNHGKSVDLAEITKMAVHTFYVSKPVMGPGYKQVTGY